MKTFALDWKGWWLLRPEMSAAPDLNSATAIYAVMGAKLRKVEKGVVCAAREPILFNLHKGGPLREHLAKMLKTSLGTFIVNRCKEIRKQPIVYAAFLPDDSDLGELAAILSLTYGAVPFAPRHHAMPAPYKGEAMRIENKGRGIGLPPEITFGVEKNMLDADQTHIREADHAMASAIARENAATRALAPEDVALDGISTDRLNKGSAPELIPTEKVAKPQVLIQTEKVRKEDVGRGLATERVARPTSHVDDTEFVPRPHAADESEDGSGILDEAREAGQS